MKKSVLAFSMLAMVLLVASVSLSSGEPLKPYVLGSEGPGTIGEKLPAVKNALVAQGFEVVGEYSPYDGAHVVVVSNESLKRDATQSKWGAYGAVERVALTAVGDQVQVSYTNPPYFAAAYRMEGSLSDVGETLGNALGKTKEFGSEKGLSAGDLRKYHYMMFMPYFDDQVKLGSFGSQEEALKAVEAGLAAGLGGTQKVYRVDLPGKNESVFGVALKEGEGADQTVMATVDFKEMKQTAHLPYDLIVSDGNVLTLHGKFRIAVDFPDLTMGTFMKISGAPGAIEDALKAVVKGK